MPFVSITVSRGLLSEAKTETLLERVEDAVVSVEGEALRQGIGVALDGLVESPRLIRNCVAFIRVTVVRDALSAAQRSTLVQRVTEAAVQVLGDDKRMGIWTVVEESVASGEWGVGGMPLTLDALAKLKQGINPFQ